MKHVYYQIQYIDNLQHSDEDMNSCSNIHSDGCIGQPVDRVFLHALLDEFLNNAENQSYPNNDEESFLEQPHFLVKICCLHK
jgi:hypothetical protein